MNLYDTPIEEFEEEKSVSKLDEYGILDNLEISEEDNEEVKEFIEIKITRAEKIKKVKRLQQEIDILYAQYDNEGWNWEKLDKEIESKDKLIRLWNV